MDEADIPYLLDALASATGGLAAARAAAQLAECLASPTGPEVAGAGVWEEEWGSTDAAWYCCTAAAATAAAAAAAVA